ncbi:hypothetical protein ACOME3_004562 [Neoechinorhynchus agilis]
MQPVSPETLLSAGLQLLIVGLAIPTFIRIAVYILKIVYTFYVFKLKSRSALLSPKYMGEWAVVTGSTDGIGLEYAKQLAEIGFNIVLVSRSQEKLDNVRSQIVSECPEVQVCTIRVDFGTMNLEEYDRIENELKSKIGQVNHYLDIGILVNNVGVSYERLMPFEQLPAEKIDQLVEVNVSSAFNMTRIVLPHMLRSGKKCIIINISSSSGIMDLPYLTAYSACKASIVSFSKALRNELEKSNVKVQCVFPGFVATKMLSAESLNKKVRTKWYVPSPEDFVRSALNTVGSLSLTSGCFAHFIYCELPNDFVPSSLMAWNVRKMMKYQEKAAKRKKLLEEKME